MNEERIKDILCSDNRRGLAENADAETQYQLGCHFDMVKEGEKAVDMFEKAAAQGHADALFELGFHYAGGMGTEQNIDRALSCWNKAARKGHRKSMACLQLILEAEKIKQGTEEKRPYTFNDLI